MSTIGKFGTELVAPTHHCSAFGTPHWSGVLAKDFTPALERDLAMFIRREATRKGNNDRVSKSIGENKSFFHPDFLGGWPEKMWLASYEQGVKSL
jgi:hypothetical protein